MCGHVGGLILCVSHGKCGNFTQKNNLAISINLWLQIIEMIHNSKIANA